MASSRPARPSPRSSLRDYRRKRDPARTPEPVPGQDDGPLPRGNDDTFVIQEHHARALHWDLRLERDGFLVSWAVPKACPPIPRPTTSPSTQRTIPWSTPRSRVTSRPVSTAAGA